MKQQSISKTINVGDVTTRFNPNRKKKFNVFWIFWRITIALMSGDHLQHSLGHAIFHLQTPASIYHLAKMQTNGFVILSLCKQKATCIIMEYGGGICSLSPSSLDTDIRTCNNRIPTQSNIIYNIVAYSCINLNTI